MQFNRLKRREFLTLLGGTFVWPLTARAQRPTMPVIGFLHARSPDDAMPQVAAFRRGLAEAGYIDGQNAIIEFRWAHGQYDKLPPMAAELVQLPAAVLFAGAEPAALAAKAATSTIPIVFSIGSDAVQLGLVASYNRPGGNTTGVSMFTAALEAKRLGLLHEVVPRTATMGLLVNPNYPLAKNQIRDVQAAAGALGLRIHILYAGTDHEIDAAFETIGQHKIVALLQAADPFLDTRRDKLVVLAARYAVPTMYHFREFPEAYGLMSYGIDILDVYHQVGVYTARILRGAKPADLPVLQPTKFQLVINLKTAKALGLTIPPGVLAIADEVIE
jgi:putative tryptophan/tyrosine transport system substrate-binding protein